MEFSERGAVVIVLHRMDNCGLTLAAIPAGSPFSTRGEQRSDLSARTLVPKGHKVALQGILAGQAVVRYGYPIGIATGDIAVGEWIHLHNCRSRFDARGNTLDPESGNALDTRYE